MDFIQKCWKAAVFGGAAIALTLSINPAFATPPQEHQDDGSGGSGGGSWTVSCSYDGNNVLQSKTCTSGGSESCNCP